MSSTSLPSIRLGAYLYTTLHFIPMIKRASTSFSCAKAKWHHKIFLFIVWPIESINCSFLCFLHYPLQRLPLHMVFLPACLCPCHAHTIELSLGICSLWAFWREKYTKVYIKFTNVHLFSCYHPPQTSTLSNAWKWATNRHSQFNAFKHAPVTFSCTNEALFCSYARH